MLDAGNLILDIGSKGFRLFFKIATDTHRLTRTFQPSNVLG